MCKAHLHGSRARDLLCRSLSVCSCFSFTRVLSDLHPAHCIFSGFMQHVGQSESIISPFVCSVEGGANDNRCSCLVIRR